MHTAVITPQTAILLGYSDGPDSRYLLEQLLRHVPSSQLHLIYCHHGLRDAANTEANNTRVLAKEKNIHCIIKKIPVKTYQKRWSVSEEMAGHFLRKSVFIHYAKKYKAQVCTGHHANDALENTQLKAERGIKDGATGLQYKYIQYGVSFLKPLLDTPKQEILDYLSINNIPYSIDESNTDLKIKRNKIRQKISTSNVPTTSETNLKQEKYYTLLHNTIHFKDDYCVIEKASFNTLNEKEISLVSRLIPQCFQEYMNRKNKILPPYWNINSDHITALLKALTSNTGGRYSFPQNHTLEWNSKYLGIYNNNAQSQFLHSKQNNKSLKKEKVLTFLRQRV